MTPPSSSAFAALDDITLKRATEQLGAPLVIFDEITLRARWEQVTRGLGGADVFFPYKSCPSTAIRRLLTSFGAGAEVASSVEMDVAIQLGVPPDRILFNQPGRDPTALAHAVDRGAWVVMDGLSDVKRVAARASVERPVRALLRVNAGVGSPVWSRFGMLVDGPELIESASAARRAPGLRVMGVQTHLGTNIWTPAPYREAAERIAERVPEIEAALGEQLSILDIGGGFATASACPAGRPPSQWNPAAPDVILAGVRAALSEAGLADRLTLWVEPGRVLVEEAAALVVRVVAVREGSAGKFVVCDGGFNLVPTAGYVRHPVRALGAGVRPLGEYDVFGPLCMQADVVAVGAKLPVDLAEGELLVIGSVGAYDMAFSFPFFTGRCAAALRGSDGEIRLIRRPELPSDLLHLEIDP